MMDILIVCNDGGELKTVTLSELQAWAADQIDGKGNASLLADKLDEALNAILDHRAFVAGEFNPADNDIPIRAVTEGRS